MRPIDAQIVATLLGGSERTVPVVFVARELVAQALIAMAQSDTDVPLCVCESSDLLIQAARIVPKGHFILWGERPPPSWSGPRLHRYRYVCNPDGTLRWLFPASTKSPLFLDLYNSANAKGRILGRVTGTLFAVGRGLLFV